MSLPRLVLAAQRADYVPPHASNLLTALQQLGLIGEHWREQRYLVGEEFLQLIVFMGCSPNIEWQPRDDLRFCHFELPQTSADPLLLAGPTLPPPRCPACRQPHQTWRSHAAHSTATLSCPQCGQATPLPAWNWRRKAMCYSRWPLSLWNIYESEAVPDCRVLDCLQQASGEVWNYSYVTQSVTQRG